MKESNEEKQVQQSSEKSKAAPIESVGGTQGQASMLTGAGNVDKIRDILFGSQMRDYEKRFIRLEDRMQKEISSLKEDLLKSFETLERYMKREFELLNEHQEKEQNDRSTAIQKVSEDLKDASQLMENKISQVEDKLNKRARELHEQLLTQSKNLSEEIRQKHEAISELLEKEAQELRLDKVNRADLSELFMEMAMRISNKADVNFALCANDLTNE